mmetsp:Transcript_7118/g.12568  ORF Transcript_7118/g.12568 Transcript_7118/m.12568 type:complete len:141 (-) Transcript_7118:490-912(-)
MSYLCHINSGGVTMWTHENAGKHRPIMHLFTGLVSQFADFGSTFVTFSGFQPNPPCKLGLNNTKNELNSPKIGGYQFVLGSFACMINFNPIAYSTPSCLKTHKLLADKLFEDITSCLRTKLLENLTPVIKHQTHNLHKLR